jgi:hypothetical protein
MNKVTSISSSYAIDLHKSGERTSHFVSATIEIDPSIEIDEIPKTQLNLSYRVSVSAVYDALMRGALTIDQANERIKIMKDNFEQMSSHFNKTFDVSEK